MKIVSIIPARGGSKGVPKKNIRDLNEQPLISYTILDSLRTPEITETYVSTDDLEIKEISEKYGAEVPFLRPKEYASDTSSDMQWAWHFLLWYEQHHHTLPDLMVHLRPTTPIREINYITGAIDLIMNMPEATSLRSVEEFPETPLKWFAKSGAFLVPVTSMEMVNLPRQLLPSLYRPNGYVDILRPEIVLGGSLHGKAIAAYVTPRTVEIDTLEDFKLAELLLKESV